ncbi:MAG: O-methyltransferase [Planctomycetota bacterium]|jgi:caffeoyl-CoA O-methyltransferase
MKMTDDRWDYTNEYSREVFGKQDGHLAGLLMMLTSMTRARLALEVGTLGGYSGIWIARGLAEGGRLITIEREPNHAAFAQRQFERAAVVDRVEIRIGAALEVLPRLAGELGPGSVDVVFIDAEKTEYCEYWQSVRPLVAVGGVVLADNVLGTGSEWIDQQDRPQPRAVDRFNRLVAGDDAFEAVAMPLRQGVLFARRFAI